MYLYNGNLTLFSFKSRSLESESTRLTSEVRRGRDSRGQQNIRCDEVWHYCVLVSEIPEIVEEFQRFLYMM